MLSKKQISHSSHTSRGSKTITSMSARQSSGDSVVFFKNILKSKLSKISEKKKLRKSGLIKTLLSAELEDRQYYTNTYVLEYDKNIITKSAFDYLINILDGYGLQRSKSTNANHLFGIINNNYFETYFFLLNYFENIESFTNKYALYFNLQTHFPVFFKESYPEFLVLSSNTNIRDLFGKIYTVNVNDVFSTTSSTNKQTKPQPQPHPHKFLNIYNEETLADAKKLLFEKYGHNGLYLTEYITNPMCFKDHKMQLRAYMLFTLINNTFKSYLFDKGYIMTAKQPYKNEDWNNKDIHDIDIYTHDDNDNNKDKERQKLHIFPDDLYGNTQPKIKDEKDFNEIWNHFKNSAIHISNIAASNIYNYANTINTFQVFEVDFAIRSDNNIYVSSITPQNYPHITASTITLTSQSRNLEKSFIDWIHETVIKPCLFPNLATNTENASNQPIYEVQYEDF